MSSLTASTQAAILNLWLNGITWPGIAQNLGSTAVTQLYISLHDADPGINGSQQTHETQYSGYARVPVPRNAWTVAGVNPTYATNSLAVVFPQCNGAVGDTLTYWGLGLAATGYGALQASGPIGPGPPFGFISDAVSLITAPGTSFAPNAQFIFYAVGGFALPAGVIEGVIYYAWNVLGNSFTLSSQPNNVAPVPTLSVGAGMLLPCTPISVIQGATPVFYPGSLIPAYMN